MPRVGREKSESGVYHVMMRGINRQDIFFDVEDKEKFIEILLRYKPVCEYKIYGYCLMSNHIHLLIKEEKETVSQVIKRIGVSYVHWYNMKYERCGHLFQGRFKSENVEDDRYLLVVLRYIHQNPVKAGIIEEAAKYRWSSYAEYVSQKPFVTDIDLVLDLLHPNRKEAVAMFKEFMIKENEDKCLGYESYKEKRMSDKDVRQLIQKLIKSDDIQVIQQMSRNERNKALRYLKEMDISIRQLARVTGLGRRIIGKA